MKKVFHTNGNKKAGVAILISDKIDFKAKAITRDKKGHFIIMKRLIQQEIVNIYIPQIRVPIYIKQIFMDIKENIDSNTVIVGDFIILLTSMVRLFFFYLNIVIDNAITVVPFPPHSTPSCPPPSLPHSPPP